MTGPVGQVAVADASLPWPVMSRCSRETSSSLIEVPHGTTVWVFTERT